MNDQVTQKEAGVLLHISSLPGNFGIGEIGQQAKTFLHAMRSMQLQVWQLLPLGPTGYGNSPYQSLSTFAGNEMLIDIQALIDDGLLTEAEAEPLTTLPKDTVDFAALIPIKTALLDAAARRFANLDDTDRRRHYESFVQSQDELWLHDYALFRVLKAHHGERSWTDWPQHFAFRDVATLRDFETDFAAEIRVFKTLQFLFHEQWQQLRQLAEELDIRFFGDIPIYVALDSADAWSKPEILRMSDGRQPERVAGVPPDYFSATGQLWGNPLYDWEAHRTSGFQWWIARIGHALTSVDLIRIDHFRGFESYWSLPADAVTAQNGYWEAGPGDALFMALREAFGDKLPIIAEDLGLISDEVNALRERNQLAGMAVLQFLMTEPGFDVSHIDDNRVCYTGTHDNDTVLGWFRGSNDEQCSEDDIRHRQETLLGVTGGSEATVSDDTIKLAVSSPARIAMVPMQDFLGLGSEARMNTPGTTRGNWQWRMHESQLSRGTCEHVATLLRDSERRLISQ